MPAHISGDFCCFSISEMIIPIALPIPIPTISIATPRNQFHKSDRFQMKIHPLLHFAFPALLPRRIQWGTVHGAIPHSELFDAYFRSLDEGIPSMGVSLLSLDTCHGQARAPLSLSSLPGRRPEVLIPIDLARREIGMSAIWRRQYGVLRAPEYLLGNIVPPPY